jgi:hypothetical protein
MITLLNITRYMVCKGLSHWSTVITEYFLWTLYVVCIRCVMCQRLTLINGHNRVGTLSFYQKKETELASEVSCFLSR